MKAKSFLDTSDRNELSEILTSERLKTAKVPTKRVGAPDPDLDEIFAHVQKADSWKGPKKKMKNKSAVRKLARK